MKQFSRRFYSLTAALILAVVLLVPMACAAARASAYFAFTDAVAYAEENGKILIEADVCATGMMDEIGVKSITIYEKQSDGYYDDVKTYTRNNTSGMIRTNNYEHFKSITYQGTIGKKYYAEIAFYAKDSEGNETLYCDTNVVTAVSVP
ncbi:hypothetical protein [Dysosmobacter sp. Sow4_B12]|uniref:hypothetical protein n=1 Tax=Dysosmobacter sp. Sow4_B12 TaxID=3438777 RepID=UPI003F8E0469